MTQLDRIEIKLDWLRWRMRWGEIKRLETTASGNYMMIPRERGIEPVWPEEK